MVAAHFAARAQKPSCSSASKLDRLAMMVLTQPFLRTYMLLDVL